MSISSLANSAAARRPDIGPADAVPNKVGEIAAAAATPPENAPLQKQEASDVNTALHVLFGYIPTEIVTLYVAVQAALATTTTTNGVVNTTAALSSQWIAFVFFLVATPLVVWVVFANKLKAAGKPLPSTYDTWPLWEMSAASFSFCAWAYALPETPFRWLEDWYSPALGSIAVLFASTVLGLLAPLFQRPLGIGPAPTPTPAPEPTPEPNRPQ
jgi:hypothetical protein